MERASYSTAAPLRRERPAPDVNHLAHALLAGDDDALLLGSLLGDFWRGAPDPAWSAGVRRGVLLHRSIDVYTDSHPVVGASRARFEPPWRRYAGILVDMYFDHALARDWRRHAAEPIAGFSQRIGALLADNAAWLPPAMNRFARYADEHGLYAAYARRTAIERALAGIGTRLRRPNPLATAGPALWAQAPALDAAFAEFFPELVAHARALREPSETANRR